MVTLFESKSDFKQLFDEEALFSRVQIILFVSQHIHRMFQFKCTNEYFNKCIPILQDSSVTTSNHKIRFPN